MRNNFALDLMPTVLRVYEKFYNLLPHNAAVDLMPTVLYVNQIPICISSHCRNSSDGAKTVKDLDQKSQSGTLSYLLAIKS